MATATNRAIWRDRGGHWEMDGKDIRGINGARFFTQAPVLYDHFVAGGGAFNSHVPQNWVTTETGAGASKAIFALTNTGDTTTIGVAGATTNNAEELAGKLVGWTPSKMAGQRPLFIEVRAKFVGTTTASDGEFWVGFADVVTATSGRAFIASAASVMTTGLTEGAMIGYSSIPTSGVLFNSGGNNFYGCFSTLNTVAATAIASTVAKDSNMHIYRVELDVASNVRYFLDGVQIGSALAVTTATTALTPYIGVVGQNSHANTATVDYIAVGGDIV